MIIVTTQRRRARTLVAALAAASFALAGCGTQSTDSKASDEATTGTSQSPSGSAGASDEPKAITVAVPIYVAGDAAGELRLFREFQQVQGEAISEAARLVDGGTPTDPDYRTLWPGGTVLSAEKTDKMITVTLDAEAPAARLAGMSERDAWLALEQMVLSLQGVVQEELPVKFVREKATPMAEPTDGTAEPEVDAELDAEADETPTTLFGIDISAPRKRSNFRKFMAMVNVTIPSQGSTVVGEKMDAEGVASSFEANVPWEIRQGDEVVLDGFVTAEGWMDKLYPWFTTIDVSDLKAGDYTFVAMTDDPSDGEGRGPTVDTKDFTIE